LIVTSVKKYKSRINKLILHDNIESQIHAENRFLRQLNEQLWCDYNKLVAKNKHLERELVVFQNFQELRQHYRRTITEQEKQINKLQLQLISLQKKLQEQEELHRQRINAIIRNVRGGEGEV